MPTSKPRVNVTVDIETYMWIDRAAKLRKTSAAEIMRQWALLVLERDYHELKPKPEQVKERNKWAF